MAKRPCHGHCFDAWSMACSRPPQLGFEQTADFVPLLGAGKIHGEATHAAEPRDLSGLDGESKDIFRPNLESVGYQRFGSVLSIDAKSRVPHAARGSLGVEDRDNLNRKAPSSRPCLRTEPPSIKQELICLCSGTPQRGLTPRRSFELWRGGGESLTSHFARQFIVERCVDETL